MLVPCHACLILVQCGAFLASGSDPTDDSRRKRFGYHSCGRLHVGHVARILSATSYLFV